MVREPVIFFFFIILVRCDSGVLGPTGYGALIHGVNIYFSVEHLNRAEDDIQQAILLLQKLQPASAQYSINPALPKNDPNDVDALRRLILKKKQIELSKQVNANSVKLTILGSLLRI